MARGAPSRGSAGGPPLVTLTTDIGWEYAAQMKAVLYRMLPTGRVVDLTHDLRPHAVGEAAFLFRHMARGFPAASVHVAVVDPGVGGRRAPIAIRTRPGPTLIGPDNGVLWPLAAELGVRSAVRLLPGRVVPGRTPSRTFEGRDLFAPAAAEVALGTPLARLGPAHRPQRLVLARPRRHSGAALGEIVHADRFGNLITNLPDEWSGRPGRPAELRLARLPPRRVMVVRAYEELPPDELGLLRSSFGLLEIAVREGSAAARLGARIGDAVEVRGRSTVPARRASVK